VDQAARVPRRLEDGVGVAVHLDVVQRRTTVRCRRSETCAGEPMKVCRTMLFFSTSELLAIA